MSIILKTGFCVKVLIIPCLFCNVFYCQAQNLVNNPGFEEFSICPNWYSTPSSDQLSKSTGWSSFRDTPDYFNSCGYPASCPVPPNNCYLGFQFPNTGQGFAGFYTYIEASTGFYNYREYIGTQLITPLIIGKPIYFSFFINRSGQGEFCLGSNNIGLKFSTIAYFDSIPAPIDNFAHFNCDSIILDSLNWVKLTGSYIPDSAYSYLIIGNFFSDTLTYISSLNPDPMQSAYYFIDDICVSYDSLYCENWLKAGSQSEIKNLAIFPNPFSNEISVKINFALTEPVNLTLIDATGKAVYLKKIDCNETTINTRNLAKGLYLLKAETEQKVELYKVMKE